MLFDFTTTATSGNWAWDGAGPEENSARVRRLVLAPSIVRLFRRERFSFFVGAGLGVEHDRRTARFRPIRGRDDTGRPILDPGFQEQQYSVTRSGILLRAGGIVSLSERVVFRTGYSYLRRYIDERPSHGIDVGLGYRF